MADTKITSLAELAAAPAGDDEFVPVDKSDTSMDSIGDGQADPGVESAAAGSDLLRLPVHEVGQSDDPG